MKKLRAGIFLFLFMEFFFSWNTKAFAVASAAPLQEGSAVTPHLFSAVDELKAGEPFDVYLLFDLAPEWHVYWRYAGDLGFPPRIEWDLPDGWSASELEFSLPEEFLEPGNIVVYGYERSALLRARITPSRDFLPKSALTIRATISWLACKNLCVPGKSTLSLSLPASSEGRLMAATLAAPAFWPSTKAPPFTVFIRHEEKNYFVSFQAEQGCCYQLFPCPAAGSTAGHVTTTEHGRYYEMKIPWEGVSPFHALLVGKDAMGMRRGWALPAASATIGSKINSLLGNLWAFLIALASGLLGGFILNLMPCVLPVISLKIFGFIKQAGTSRLRVFHHGLAFVAGIYLWFLALGMLVVILKASGMQVTWAFQFQSPLFLLVLNVLVFLFALNLFGVFEIHLPGQAGSSLDALASRNGYAGSFFQGLFATLLATPCTAPFLGSALGFAFAQSGIIIMTMFVAIATGMALPYLILSAQPVWMKWLPRPGAWMEKIKMLMGFPLLATNLWLLSVLGAQRGLPAVMMLLALLFILGMSAWIYGAVASLKTNVRRAASLLVLAMVLAAFWYVIPKIMLTTSLVPARSDSSSSAEKNSISKNSIAWIPYSTELLERLRHEGKAVFVDFTAAWCLTCQFNEQTAIETNAVRTLLHDRGIIPMKADWTNANSEITTALKSFGRVGVPFYVFYPASSPNEQSKPITFSELLTESQLVKAFSGRAN